MALFPKIEPGFYDDNDKGMRERMESFYRDSISINESYWIEADIDTRFEAGDQTLWEELYGNVHASRRKQFNFNRIRRVVNMIGGYQRRNRKSTISIPVENSDQETADQFSKILMWADRQEGILETLSDAFHGSIVSGMNLLHVWMDYREDPINGNIKVDRCAYNSFLIDPFFRKSDLSDCNGLWKRSFLTKSACISLLPYRKEEIMACPLESGRDGKFQFLPENYDYSYTNLLAYDEYYYRDYRKQKMLVDTKTGATMEWPSQGQEKDLKDYLQYFPEVSVVEQEIPTVKLSILVNGKVMYDGPNPLGIDQYPFVPVLSYYNPDIPYYQWRVQGVVRGLRDAQYLYNRRKVIELDILESQLNSGWIYKENALTNPKDIYMTGQGKGLSVKANAQLSDVQKIPPAEVPQSMMQLSQSLAQEIQEISGVNEELLGSATDEKAGILSMLRQGAGLTTLQRLFDQLDYAQKLLGKILVNVIQNNFTPGKIERIIESTPSQEFYDKSFGKYDVSIEEGFYTSTQKQVQFAQLLHLRETGVPISDEVLLNAATIQNKKEIIDDIAQKQQQAEQQAQQQMQIQQQQAEAEARLVNARATADEGLGQERMSRIAENQALAVERRAKAEENRAQAEKDKDLALLNLIKAIKEVETIDIGNVAKLIQLEKIMQTQKEPIVQTQEPIAQQQSNQLQQQDISSLMNMIQQQ